MIAIQKEQERKVAIEMEQHYISKFSGFAPGLTQEQREQKVKAMMKRLEIDSVERVK